MSYLRKIVDPALPEFLALAKKLEGKTIKKIEYGYGEHITDVLPPEI